MSTFDIHIMPNPGVKPGHIISIGHDLDMSGVITLDQFCKRSEDGGDLFFEATAAAFSALLFAFVDTDRFLAALPATIREEYMAGLEYPGGSAHEH